MTDTPDSPESTLSGDVIGAPDVSGEWLPPAAAATRLGVSERTLWRHVNAGRYHKRTVSGRTEVLVPGGGTTPDNSASATGLVVPDNDRQMSLAVIDELRRQHGDVMDRLTRQADEIRAEAVARAAAEAARDAQQARADDLAARLAKVEEERDAERTEVRALLQRIAARRWYKPSTW